MSTSVGFEAAGKPDCHCATSYSLEFSLFQTFALVIINGNWDFNAKLTGFWMDTTRFFLD